MQQRTNEQILAKVMELWPDVFEWEPESRKLNLLGVARIGDTISFNVTKMYEKPGSDYGSDEGGLTFAKRLELSKFFDTMNVETDNEIADSGCETCNWGSAYGFTVIVRPGDPYTKIELPPGE